MTGRDGFVASMRAALGPGGVLGDGDDLARYARDWTGDHVGRPLAVARPRTTEEVQALVRLAASSGVPLVPQGGHTGLCDAATPTEAGTEVVVSLERMNRIRSIDAADFSLVAEAGAVLAEVKAAAEAADLHFPLSLGAQGSCRIGGNIATNAGGVNVLRYGMTRALVLGLEVVLPDGSLVSDLRSLRKNNTGYDLKQLFVGAEGTLGIVTAATLRLFPRPVQRETALLGCPSLAAVVALFGRARRELGDLVSAFELMTRDAVEAALEETGTPEPFDPPSPAYVLMDVATSAGRIALRELVEGFLGDAMEAGLVENGAVAASEAQAAAFWSLREGIVEWQHKRGRHLRSDVSVAISQVPDFVVAAEAAVRAAGAAVVHSYGHVGDGNVHLTAEPGPEASPEAEIAAVARLEAAVLAEVDRFGGSISAEHGIGRKKRAAHLARLPAAERRVAEGLRHLLDPAGIMNPGRVV